MKCLLLVLAATVGLGSSAFAASSSCVVYVDSSANSQYSCDGADLQDLYSSSSITAAISKAIPHFLDLGYSLSACTDSFSDGPHGSGTAYSRCVFTKK